MKHGKKYLDSKKSYETLKLFDVHEGLETVLSTAKAKFDETIEISVRLGVDPRHADQQVRGAVVLPHGARARPSACWCSPRPTRRARRRKPARIMWATRIWSRRSRRRTGLISTSASRPPGHDGRRRPYRPRARPQGPHAEPEERHGHDGRGQGHCRHQSR